MTGVSWDTGQGDVRPDIRLRLLCLPAVRPQHVVRHDNEEMTGLKSMMDQSHEIVGLSARRFGIVHGSAFGSK